MVTKINTPPLQSVAGAKTGSGSNAILYIIIGSVALYLGYKYIIKPSLEKKEGDNK